MITPIRPTHLVTAVASYLSVAAVVVDKYARLMGTSPVLDTLFRKMNESLKAEAQLARELLGLQVRSTWLVPGDKQCTLFGQPLAGSAGYAYGSVNNGILTL